MELVSGGELFTEITTKGEPTRHPLHIHSITVHPLVCAHKLRKIGKLEESDARKYMGQLIDGLSYCHRQGIVHRNLKVLTTVQAWPSFL